jgi:hypothetical protein
MSIRTLPTRAIYFAARAPLLVAVTAAAMTTGALAQEVVKSVNAFCVIHSVSIPQACPSTVSAQQQSSDGYMSIHMDNQKIGSAVAQYWAAQTAVGTGTVASPPAGETAMRELRTRPLSE